MECLPLAKAVEEGMCDVTSLYLSSFVHSDRQAQLECVTITALALPLFQNCYVLLQKSACRVFTL